MPPLTVGEPSRELSRLLHDQCSGRHSGMCFGGWSEACLRGAEALDVIGAGPLRVKESGFSGQKRAFAV